MTDIDDLLADRLEEPEQVLGILSDIVEAGRLQADELPSEAIGILSRYQLVAFLITRRTNRPLRSWVYPTPLGLSIYGVLEREAERVAAEEKLKPRVRKGRGKRTGVSR